MLVIKADFNARELIGSNRTDAVNVPHKRDMNHKPVNIDIGGLENVSRLVEVAMFDGRKQSCNKKN